MDLNAALPFVLRHLLGISYTGWISFYHRYKGKQVLCPKQGKGQSTGGTKVFHVKHEVCKQSPVSVPIIKTLLCNLVTVAGWSKGFTKASARYLKDERDGKTAFEHRESGQIEGGQP